MNDRQDFIGNFLTEHYTVYVDGVETDNISAGGWSDLGQVMDAAEARITPGLPDGKKVLTRYINIHKFTIHFWTYKDNEWFTL